MNVAVDRAQHSVSNGSDAVLVILCGKFHVFSTKFSWAVCNAHEKEAADGAAAAVSQPGRPEFGCVFACV
jgi:hypothetical protein